MATVTKRSLLLSFSLLLLRSPHASSLRFDLNFSVPGVLAGADLKYMSSSTAAVDRIDLTNGTWTTGRVAYGRPLQLWDNSTGEVASFTSNFTFAIKPVNTTAQGDGMAFFVAPFPGDLPQDARGGFLGLFNNRDNPVNTFFPPTVAVEFDAFRNTWDPNGTMNHVGVDVNSIASAAYAALPDGSFNGTMSAWLRYDARARALSAELRFDDLPALGLYSVWAAVDLRAAGLPQDAAVGFSGATGDYVERHQILSWSFESTLSSVPAIDSAASNTSGARNIGLRAGLASAAAVTLVAFAAAKLYRERYRYLKRIEMQARKQTQQWQEHEDADAETPLNNADMDDEFEKGTGPRRFSYGELSRATRGFADGEKLGEGGFGSVYRGFLPDLGVHVAIKRISKTSRQGRREYISEVTIISRLRHRNLVQLVGWCHDADELLLVYELMTNGSLDTHLYGSGSVLSWPIRYGIVLGMGSALMYLHQEWEQCVVHRDIKPSNVMLDAAFNAKVGDFGLARLVDHGRGAHTTVLAGTTGYMDPECVITNRASAKSDVYSFGVVLLEVACGRKPVVPGEDESRVLLVQWVWGLYGGGAVLDAADARLADGEVDEAQLERVLVVGLWCVHPDYRFRPSIRQAMNVLQFEAPLPDLPPERPVATYGPPAAASDGSSSSGTASTGGHSSSTSDRTAGSFGSSAASGSHGARSRVTSQARGDPAAASRQEDPAAEGSSTGTSGRRRTSTSTTEQFPSARCSSPALARCRSSK